MWGSATSDAVLETLARLRSQSCQDRLKEMVLGTLSDKSALWLLGECQPCPTCFVLSRRETGCNHIVCRCGCDFCFQCGAPTSDSVCLCDRLHPDCRSGNVFFAAWLRASDQSPCDWLWEKSAACYKESPDRPSDFMATLGFFLWAGGAEIPVVWEGSDQPRENEQRTVLSPLKWFNGSYVSDEWRDDFSGSDFGDSDLDEFDEWHSTKMQDLDGHLRKEAYSRQSQRSLRHGRHCKTSNRCAKVNRTLY